MAHLPNLIIDLALILGAAAIIIIVFKWLRQPLVLGYIIAGFLVGPYFDFLPTVQEDDNIRIWAEIGVIFLLFSLGIEFSFKKLLRVGSSASITAIVEVIVMSGLGYIVGQIMGWSVMDSIFLGAILSISSTTIIIRALDELGLKTKHFASLVFGVLIVEDLLAIVLMIILTTVAVSQQFAGAELFNTMLKLIFFLAIWFALGIFFIPSLLKRSKKILNDEMLLIISLALCLGMVVFANNIGFSPALGAFIMGSILAETTRAEKIEHLIMPVKDLFGAIFFVSVGMMIDPQVLIDYAGPIVIICLVTVLGKIFSTGFGALLSGQTLQTSVQTGFSLSQIGEFSFIIATLGLTLGVTSGFLYPITVAVSAVTTLTTPYLVKASTPFYRWLAGILPKDMVEKLNRYTSETKNVTQTSEWKIYLRNTLLSTVMLSAVMFSIIILLNKYVLPLFENEANPLTFRFILVLVSLLILSPFLWALAIRIPPGAFRVVEKGENRAVLLVVRILKLGIATFFIGYLLTLVFNIWIGMIFTVIVVAILVGLTEKIEKFYSRLENRFFTNLNQREIATAEKNRTELAPWNAHIVPMKVFPDSVCVGKRLLELRWREQLGVNIVMIKREDLHIPAPGKEQVLYPGDELLVLGTDMQIQKLKVLLRPNPRDEIGESSEVELYLFPVQPGSPFIGKNIREAGFREVAEALVVGVERRSERLLNPDSTFVLEENDLVFIVGNRKKLKALIKSKPTVMSS